MPVRPAAVTSSHGQAGEDEMDEFQAKFMGYNPATFWGSFLWCPCNSIRAPDLFTFIYLPGLFVFFVILSCCLKCPSSKRYCLRPSKGSLPRASKNP